MRFSRFGVAFLGLCFALPLHASPAPPPEFVARLDTIDVTGAQPGPGMWRVEHPGTGHVLMILGSHTPVPRRVQWDDSQAMAVLAQAGAVLAPPSVNMDSGIGRVRGMLMLPSLLRARRNPGGARLAEVLPEDLYARWQVQKQAYLGRSRKTDDWRPLFAARELYDEAIGKAGLSGRNPVWPVVRRAAEKRGVPVLTPEITVRIEAPREMLREFSERTLDDLPCMEATLGLIESHMPELRRRAEAWAVGYVDYLRNGELPQPDQACLQAMLGAAPEDREAFANLPERALAKWLETAEGALREHELSLAVVSVTWLLGTNGPLQALAERGYRIEAPDADG